MSYTEFTWDDPELAGTNSDADSPEQPSPPTVSVAVTNSGAQAGTEVVQVYLNVARGTYLTPLPTLAGFAKTRLDAGASAIVTIELDSELTDRARQQQSDGIEDAGLVWIGPSADPQELIECGRV
jgi:beta-glucosidase